MEDELKLYYYGCCYTLLLLLLLLLLLDSVMSYVIRLPLSSFMLLCTVILLKCAWFNTPLGNSDVGDDDVLLLSTANILSS